ncbi:MAG TPA: aminoglycoside phosphotransferase family protein [Gaiellaceae bacterium]|nr:aminoglycoside phosphotransferase family protein [Gaiellaceae bacterium]
MVERHGLVLGEPFEVGAASVLVVPGVTSRGEEVVLKLQDPHRESEHEAAALELWDGDGAVRLLDHEAEEHALLLERCVPGTPLSAAGADAALDVFVELLPRLWKPAGPPFGTLADEAAWWAGSLEDTWERFGRPFERPLLDAALEALRELPPTQSEQVLLNQDLHGDNVLAAQREPWLAIDPKPLTGEREFGIAPIVRSRELGHSRAEVLGRFDRLTSDLALDRERARGWTIGQTIAWAFNGRHHPGHAEVARWLLEGR